MNIKKIIIGSAASVIMLASVAVSAFAVGSNGSFETGPPPGVFTTLSAGNISITGWTVGPGSIDYIGTYWQSSPPGGRSIDLNGNATGSISQTLTTVVGKSYKVTFDMSGNPDGLPSLKTLSVTATGTGSQTFSFTTGTNTHANMMWVGKSYTFVATTASTTLTFASTIAGAFGPALDNVVVTELVGPPTEEKQCRKKGWMTFNNPTFRNQGECIAFVEKHEHDGDKDKDRDDRKKGHDNDDKEHEGK